ncbi:hypothetical protein [Formosa sp. PL04]|uniref:hypothetical protein n=1 Tax=Formosa sp. PL04 TaxID=3081755 RepID=UPI002980BD2B|nr:hypothetical protein [Formosa sp. PL04]MDW5287550.1 hypothetical protein [Formosa sp. PL04]
MKKENIYIGNIKSKLQSQKVKGKSIEINNETFFKISNSNVMRPFFMSIVSDSNHWMFVSSNGGLTAGRKDCDSALFPYNTDDKITESVEITGSKTIFKIHKKKKTLLWEPFSNRFEGVYKIQRNLYKNSFGNKIIFEEINKSLGLAYSYEWNSSNVFGFVKKATLTNTSSKKKKITVLDGLQNLIPSGLSADMQNSKSNLVDAYKKNELETETGLGIYTLSAIIVDKAEPSESLKSTTVWSVGFKNPMYLISSLQLNNFRKGKEITQEVDVRAEKGAYFTVSEIELKENSEKKWMQVANVNQSATVITEISTKIKNKESLIQEVEQDIELGTQNLVQLTGNADGIEVTADVFKDTRHFANTLFNIMRGGIFDENYQIEAGDFKKYISKANKDVYSEVENEVNSLSEVFTLKDLQELASKNKNTDFKRLCAEYLPLKFSRRHGDPSRPWNKFSINTRSEIDGSKILDYQGNWRDIFQNWEALAHSYPAFIENMIFKFLNATTFEGYNPYRVTKDGFDWEIVEPDDPWSFIGYWGDHQIIYLLKFLEFAENYYPNQLEKYFNEDLFVYANVPYKIKSYEDTLKHPKDTIDFDYDLDSEINKRKAVLGADGALLLNQQNAICKVNLMEKLLATVLAKVSNFIPEAGIWLNTQRPEWNDANNALVGNGVSMVTLYYLRRFLHFFEQVIEKSKLSETELSEEVAVFFNTVLETLTNNKQLLNGAISDENRKSILDGLGTAGSNFRTTIYKNGFSAKKKTVSKTDLLSFTKVALEFIDHSIKANKRADNLYHAYNLITIKNKEISIAYLPEMLEGQVAVLSSGELSSKESLALLNGLKKSDLYRKDQSSYLLYPNKQLARFVGKNIIPTEKVEKLKLVHQLLKVGNTQIIEKDIEGNYHFNGNFNNANSVKDALAELPEKEYGKVIKNEAPQLLAVFEEVFNHKYFTGRSGTFYGYEGLGSIYWHMVSKLALAVQEICVKAVNKNESKELVDQLIAHYYEINEGIGVHKSPTVYGAFPTDPYSHTPGGKGAQQPGMTGQVKEDFLSRFGELGVLVEDGKIQFNPCLLKEEEFLKSPKTFNYWDVKGVKKEIQLEENSLCFTYCQVPVIYQKGAENTLTIFFEDNSTIQSRTLSIDAATSTLLFERAGEVEKVTVTIKN